MSIDDLDERERRILRLILQGKSTAEIAEALYVRHETAVFRVRRIREKLGAANRSELVRIAQQEGFGAEEER